MFDTWEIEVPGTFRADVAFLDLETRKVPCEWTFPNGVSLSRRWSAFLAGVTQPGRIVLVERTGSEEDFLTGVREAIGSAEAVAYRSANSFDEGILRGRFTYARRGWAPEPFYPAMPGADELNWKRLRPEPNGFWESARERELMSVDVPATYETDSGLVLVHLLRDVAEMIGAYCYPDDECATWCFDVLTRRDFAESVLFGGEPEDS